MLLGHTFFLIKDVCVTHMNVKRVKLLVALLLLLLLSHFSRVQLCATP